MSEPIVRFVGIGKTYDGLVQVVDALDLDIERGEFLTLLGPSGSGKTTTLMMLAGFETADGGRDPARRPAAVDSCRRTSGGIGMVFQNYALFPHMTVAENIGFPAAVRGMPRPRSRSASRARWTWSSSARFAGAAAGAAFRRPAAACRARPGAGLRAEARADGRAARRARQAAARADAVRDPASAPAAGRHRSSTSRTTRTRR